MRPSHASVRRYERDDPSVDAQTVAALWGLTPHPEGGHYRETYRSEMLVELPGWTGPRALATSILDLLAEG